LRVISAAADQLIAKRLYPIDTRNYSRFVFMGFSISDRSTSQEAVARLKAPP